MPTCFNCQTEIQGAPRYCPHCRAVNEDSMVYHLSTVKARMEAGTATKEDTDYFNTIIQDIQKFNRPKSIHPDKKAWIAILLNCFPLIMGTGYIYLGRWKRFFLTIGIQFIIPSIFNTMGQYNTSNSILLFTWLFTIFEAYALTKRWW